MLFCLSVEIYPLRTQKALKRADCPLRTLKALKRAFCDGSSKAGVLCQVIMASIFQSGAQTPTLEHKLLFLATLAD
jgi:hypothetical protein